MDPKNNPNNILAKAFIILSLAIPFINLDIVFGDKYLNKSLLYTNELLDSALWPKFLALTLMLLLFTLIILFASKKEHFKANVFNQKIFIALAIFVLANFVSILYAHFIPQAIVISIKNLVFLIYFTIGFIVISKLQNAYIFISKSLVIFGLFAGLLGVFQICNLIVEKEINNKFMFFVNATFANKNLFSQILLLSFPFAVYTAIRNTNIWRWVSILTGIIELLLIVLIYSRAVLLGLFISSFLSIFLLVYFRHWFKLNMHQIRIISIYYIVFLITITSTIFIYTKYNTIRPTHDTISSYKDTPTGSTKERLMLWKATAEMIADKPIIGVGAGNWEIYLRKYSPIEIRNSGDSFYFNFKRAHNEYLQTAAEIGLVGVLSFIGMFLIIISYAIQVIKKSQIKAEQYFALLILFSINSYLIISFFSFPKERVSHWIILLLIFISISISRSKGLLRNKLTKSSNVILCGNKSKNIGIAVAMARLFDEISVQKNELEWSSYFVTIPKLNENNKIVNIKSVRFGSFFIFAILVFAIAISIYKIKGEIHTRKAYHFKDVSNHLEVIKEIKMADSYFYQMDLSVTPIKWYSATAWFLLDDIKKAQYDYNKAYTIHPYHIHNINDLATTYELQGNHNMSIHYYKEALAISPKFDEVLLNLSIVYYNLSDFDSAYYYLKQCNTENNNPKYKLASELILNEVSR